MNELAHSVSDFLRIANEIEIEFNYSIEYVKLFIYVFPAFRDSNWRVELSWFEEEEENIQIIAWSF